MEEADLPYDSQFSVGVANDSFVHASYEGGVELMDPSDDNDMQEANSKQQLARTYEALREDYEPIEDEDENGVHLNESASHRPASTGTDEPYFVCFGHGKSATCRGTVHMDHCVLCRMPYASLRVFSPKDHLHVCSCGCLREALVYAVSPKDSETRTDLDTIIAENRNTRLGSTLRIAIAYAELTYKEIELEYVSGMSRLTHNIVPARYNPPFKHTEHLQTNRKIVQAEPDAEVSLFSTLKAAAAIEMTE